MFSEKYEKQERFSPSPAEVIDLYMYCGKAESWSFGLKPIIYQYI